MGEASLALTGRSRPILFSPTMSRAIRAGVKTETRRELKLLAEPPSAEFVKLEPCFHAGGYAWQTEQGACTCVRAGRIRCWPGDLLWVRERFTTYRDDSAEESRVKRIAAEKIASLDDMVEFARLPGGSGDERVLYAADFLGCDEVDWQWRPSIHMPKAAARTWLLVDDVTVERLHAIDEAAATREGCDHIPEAPAHLTNRTVFAKFWDVLNGAGAWDANPLVEVIKFHLINRADYPEVP